MISLTVVNWVLILFLMIVSYTSDIDDHILEQPDNMRYLIPTVHALFGLPAQLLATYIVYRMLREDTQVAAAKRRGARGSELERYWFKNAKPLMRLTLTLWLVTSAFGIITYLVRYDVVPTFSLGSQPPPIATEAIAPEETPEATDPAATPEQTDESFDPLATPEPEGGTSEAEAPVETPEVADATRRPTRTPRSVSPVQTPEVRSPVLTPEVVPDPEPEDDSSGMGMGSD
jgi:hypothetical protein